MYKMYPPGGYGAVLGRTTYNSYFNLNYLLKKRWFDVGTRMVCIEFLVYNVNYNVFSSVKLILEKTAGGYFDQAYTVCTIYMTRIRSQNTILLAQVKTTRLLFVESQLEYVTVFFVTIFHVLLLLIVIRKFYGLIASVTQYFRDFWNIIDIVIIVMSVTCIALFAYRIRLVGDFLMALKYAKRNQFITFDHLFHIEDVLNVVAALLLCITTVRLWKLLRFARMFLKLEQIIVFSFVPLAALFLCQVVLVLGFASCGCLLYGTQSSYFKGILASICSLFYISLNLYKSFDYEVLISTQGLLGNIYYILFMFITFTIYTLYVTVIIMGCEMSDDYFSNMKQEYTVYDFLREEILYFTELFKINMMRPRLRAGGENNKPKVYPKEDSIRYGNCMKTSQRKMEAMRTVAKAVVWNSRSRKRPSNFGLMLDVVATMNLLDMEEDDKEMFFVVSKDGKRKLVDDLRLLQMERVVRKLLQGEMEVVEQAPSCAENLDYISESLDIILDIVKQIEIETK